MEQAEVLRLFTALGAIVEGSHFVYASGRHGPVYVNKDAIYPHTTVISRLCRVLAERFSEDAVGTVVAPAVGGVILSQWTAHHLTEMSNRQVFGVYAEKRKHEGAPDFFIGREFGRFVTGRKVLVVEDILNTGRSAEKVVEAVRELGGHVVGLGALCNRGSLSAETIGNVPKLIALMRVTFEAWDRKECPLCGAGVPIDRRFGRWRVFLREEAERKTRGGSGAVFPSG